MNKTKVLVTGSSGFIGSHVVDYLHDNGYDVVLYDEVPSKYKQSSYNEHIGSILDKNKLEIAMEGCDIVYHFAAQADINASNDSPLNTIESNIMGTQNVLEVSRGIGLKRFIFASTVYVFSDLGSFYRVSKQASEKIIEEYNKQFNLNYTILRYGSLYGSRANKFNFISNILIQALTEKKIERKGDGKELREYIHVKDAARLSIQALDEEYENQHLIITGHQQVRVKDLLYMIKEIFNNEIEISFGGEKDVHHYQITPYNYRPKIAKKLSPNEYYDLGQGLLEQIYDLSDILGNKDDNINLRKK